MEKKVREARELTKQLKASKSKVRRLESDMESPTKGTKYADMGLDEITDLGVRATEELKRAQTVREQIHAGIPEHKAIAKENADLRQKLKDANNESKIM